jgi:hypothetical protein
MQQKRHTRPCAGLWERGNDSEEVIHAFRKVVNKGAIVVI